MSEKENNDKQSGFGLPGDYFRNSAAKLKARMEWVEEHRAFPHLLALNRQSGFTVPEGYFQSESLELAAYPSLAALRKISPFSVPEAYFENNVEKLHARIKSEAEAGDFLVLPGIPKTNPFAVPQDYFAGAGKYLQELLVPQRKKQVRIFTLRRTLQVAALLLIALGLWLYRSYQEPVAANDCGGIACLDRGELLNAGDVQNSSTEDLYELVDPKLLEKKLDKKEKATEIKPDSGSAVEDDYLPDDI